MLSPNSSAINAKIDGKDGQTTAEDAMAGFVGSRIGDAAGQLGAAWAGNMISDKAAFIDTAIQAGKTVLSKLTSKGVSEPMKESIDNKNESLKKPPNITVHPTQ